MSEIFTAGIENILCLKLFEIFVVEQNKGQSKT